MIYASIGCLFLSVYSWVNINNFIATGFFICFGIFATAADA